MNQYNNDNNVQPQPAVQGYDQNYTQQPYMQNYPPMPMQPPVEPQPSANRVYNPDDPLRPWNGLCIAGFVCAFVFSPVGLVLSIIALVQISKTHEKNKSMAIAGIAISGVSILLSILAVVFAVGVLGEVLDHVDINETRVCVNGECRICHDGKCYTTDRGEAQSTSSYVDEYLSEYRKQGISAVA